MAPGYLSSAYSIIRDAGGLCIADEVQAGFARTGSHFWGFEGHGVVPDIVTMAKVIFSTLVKMNRRRFSIFISFFICCFPAGSTKISILVLSKCPTFRALEMGFHWVQ